LITASGAAPNALFGWIRFVGNLGLHLTKYHVIIQYNSSILADATSRPNNWREPHMKNVAVIWSSPNTDGLTASAKDQFVLGLTDAGTQVREIHLNRKRIEHCRV